MTPTQITSAELDQDRAGYLKRVDSGQVFLVTKHGRPRYLLVPAELKVSPEIVYDESGVANEVRITYGGQV